MPAFEEHPNGYSATNARFFAEVSRLAYKDKDKIQATVQGWGLGGDFAFFDEDDMQGFLASDAGWRFAAPRLSPPTTFSPTPDSARCLMCLARCTKASKAPPTRYGQT